ncbi:MAG TPA: hypothetical protein H9858_12460 [Candidatus Blautia stercoravium]|nr:hypothetical protein [Candidatus Blautia stercoravium]
MKEKMKKRKCVLAVAGVTADKYKKQSDGSYYREKCYYAGKHGTEKYGSRLRKSGL